MGAGAGRSRYGFVVGSGRVIMTGNNTYGGGTTIMCRRHVQLGTSAIWEACGSVSNEGVFNIVNADHITASRRYQPCPPRS